MISKFVVTGTDTKISFEATAKTATIQAVIENAAEYLFNHGYGDHGTEEKPVLYASLTNQQKLALVGTHLKQVILDLANTHKSVKAQEAARAAEEAAKYSV